MNEIFLAIPAFLIGIAISAGGFLVIGSKAELDELANNYCDPIELRAEFDKCVEDVKTKRFKK